MFDLTSILILLAQEEKPAPAQPDFFEYFMGMLPLVLILIVLYQLMIIRPEQKDRLKKDEFYSSLKKNDRILTTSGIYGTIASVSKEVDEAVIKIDDNTRMTIRKSSIQGKIENKKPESKDSK